MKLYNVIVLFVSSAICIQGKKVYFSAEVESGEVGTGESETVIVDSGEEINGNVESGPKTCVAGDDVTEEYLNAYNPFLAHIYKTVLIEGNANFVFSAWTVWLSLAALAEGGGSATKEQLFKFLHLPEDSCLRQKIYKRAKQIIVPDDDVQIITANTLVVDEGLKISSQWDDLVSTNSLLNVLELPIKSDPEKSIKIMEQLTTGSLGELNMTGNSILMNMVQYNGLWTTTFSEAKIERSPFYNQKGEHIGYVDLMRMKKRARINDLPKGIKILELPVGKDERYRILFTMVDSDNIFDDIDTNIKRYMYMSRHMEWAKEPVEIAIPRLGVMSTIDFRMILEGMGIKDLWTDKEATRFISEPAALPSSFVQHATFSLNTGGVEPSLQDQPLVSTGCTNDFIANKPVLFSLYDAKTFTALITVAYSVPTYPK